MQIKDVRKLLGITVATTATVASLTACSFNPRDNEAVAMYGVEYPEVEATTDSTLEEETQSTEEAEAQSTEGETSAETEETKAVVDDEQQNVEETSTEEEYGPNKDAIALMYGVFPDEDTTEAPEK